MNRRFLCCAAVAAVILVTLGLLTTRHQIAQAQETKRDRLFEIRTYTAATGKLDALNARFRDHTTKLFEKHGMTNVGYWVPSEGDKAANTLIYVIAHENRDAADRSWRAFGADPEWQKVAAESEKAGKVLARAPERMWLKATDYSPLK